MQVNVATLLDQKGLTFCSQLLWQPITPALLSRSNSEVISYQNGLFSVIKDPVPYHDISFVENLFHHLKNWYKNISFSSEIEDGDSGRIVHKKTTDFKYDHVKRNSLF